MRSLALTALSLAVGCSAVDRDRVAIRGSDSEVNLVQRLAEAFMLERPDVFVSVTGGGSGVGIAALIDGTCDLASSSRPLYPEERLLALRSGVEPTEHVFARDALTFVVHADNPVDALSLDVLGAALRGEVERWSALGGEDVPVVIYGRQASSGTYAWLRDAVVKGDYAPTSRQMSGSSQIAEAVAHDPGGLGYVAVGYLQAGARGIRALRVRTEGGPMSPLDHAAVDSGAYPVVRPLFQYADGEPTGAIRDFLCFQASSTGTELIHAMGFHPSPGAPRPPCPGTGAP